MADINFEITKFQFQTIRIRTPTTMTAPVGLAKRFGESLFVNVRYASAGDHSVSGAGVTWKF